MENFAYNVRNVCSVRELIETSADEFASRDAFLVKNKDGDIKPVSYAEFFAQIKALSTYLCSLGLEYKKIACSGMSYGLVLKLKPTLGTSTYSKNSLYRLG